MKQFVTTGIILARTDFGEADRILTILTPDYGKLHLLARGVRKVKSKLAGGIELFSISSVTFIRGRGELGTLVSTRLNKHYGNIIKDIESVQLGYELIKLLNKATEDEPEPEYFELLHSAFAALHDGIVTPLLLRSWFQAQLLRLAGHTPNLQSEPDGKKLDASLRYNFSFDDMAFAAHPEGAFSANDIKGLRLLFSGTAPAKFKQVDGLNDSVDKTAVLLQSMYRQYIRM